MARASNRLHTTPALLDLGPIHSTVHDGNVTGRSPNRPFLFAALRVAGLREWALQGLRNVTKERTAVLWLLSAISAFLGLKYSQLFYMIFVPLSSAMACKVFRMVLLCDTTVEPLKTAEIHEMLHWEHQEAERTLASLAPDLSQA
ncbi:hypothetical protein HWV62_42271 [Athelia sp. TMB]|nr:hypothetical protein HWV62_17044 [Athelia sp. TMB]KAF7979460.1 hypothetical protein HWV62_42271 [Athelia sp. TMB]